LDYKKLHNHILQEHDLFLFEDQIKEIVDIVLEMDDQKLFNYMYDEHDLLLLEGQKREIVDIVLEMHNEKPETCTMDTNYKVETNINGWQRVIIDFTVKSKPRWWQFWKPRIDEQDFQYSVWLKAKDELFLYKPQIEKK
jgi:hypothetical protein